ncbi:MAG TPA: TetR/AcrR family transcriptional regulator [Bryobacteraceae bacterium]|nr:TetR/AcrR family transcriptional regulator [Bryobacteraceae bacterium]
MTTPNPTSKAEETSLKILDAALELFREQGFDSATMRDIASKAGVATGAAYYYYASKDAIVMAFYERAWQEMQPAIESAIAGAKGFEAKLRAMIRVKLDYFVANRAVLRALLRTGADAQHPLSPFSADTAAIREGDIAWFRRILEEGGIRVPRDLAPHLPGALWFFQMGAIYFWVMDDSPNQARAGRLLQLGAKIVTSLLRMAGLPLTRPMRKAVIEVMELVRGDA